jgi:transposase
MTESELKRRSQILVAIDIAKVKHDILTELPDGTRKRMTIKNQLIDFNRLADYLRSFDSDIIVGIEPTADYHRNLAHFLKLQSFNVRFLSSVAVARTREALHNSWDKNDPKDAQVILHLMKTGVTQYFYDPVIEGTNDLQELSNTHFQVSLRKVKLQHSLLNHYLPLYFPEAEAFLCATRAGWFAKLLTHFPIPTMVTSYSKQDFIDKAVTLLPSKHSKRAMLDSFYEAAANSVGIKILANSHAIAMFRLTLKEHLDLCSKRAELEELAHSILKDNSNYKILRSVPGIGPIIALTVLAEAGDLRRFSHERQFLKYCGLDLSTQQSGGFRGGSKISKRGNGRLRSALWIAAGVAVRMRENSFRRKLSRYIQRDPTDKNLKRKAMTACSAKMARVVYGLIKNQQFYRSFHEEAVPGGRTRSHVPLEQLTP